MSDPGLQMDIYLYVLYSLAYKSMHNGGICFQLANVLQIDAQAVKNAVSLYCRLGFARKKNHDSEYADLNPTWRNVLAPTRK
jgi:hypothetical protein